MNKRSNRCRKIYSLTESVPCEEEHTSSADVFCRPSTAPRVCNGSRTGKCLYSSDGRHLLEFGEEQGNINTKSIFKPHLKTAVRPATAHRSVHTEPCAGQEDNTKNFLEDFAVTAYLPKKFPENVKSRPFARRRRLRPVDSQTVSQLPVQNGVVNHEAPFDTSAFAPHRCFDSQSSARDWSFLPAEVAEQIFLKLSSANIFGDCHTAATARLVCKQWKDCIAASWLSIAPSCTATKTDWASKWNGLENLNLSNISSGIVPKEVEGLRVLTRLRSLTLTSSPAVTDGAVDSLVGLTVLCRLNLAGCSRLTDAGLAAICNIRSLVSLSLDGCIQVTDRGLLSVQKLVNLTSISLRECWQLSDRCLQAFRGGAGLASLSLDHSNVSSLAEMPAPGSLTSLSLKGCLQLDASTLSRLDHLTELNLSGCKQVSDEWLLLLTGLTGLSSLDVSHCPLVGDSAGAFLAGLSCLERLNLAGCEDITDECVRPLRALSGLRHLDLSGCKYVGDAAVAVAQGIPALETLNLTGCFLASGAAVSALGRLSSLTGLSLGGCSKLPGAWVQELSRLCSLALLDLSGCRVGDAGLRALSGLGGLQALSLAWCDLLTDDGFAGVKRWSSLQSLDVRGCRRLSDKTLAHLGRCTDLQTLHLGGCGGITDAGLHRLSSFPSLTWLDLSWCRRISDSGLPCLSQLPHLKTLRLSSCWRITDAATDALLFCSRLRVVDCADTSMSGAGLRRLASNGIRVEKLHFLREGS